MGNFFKSLLFGEVQDSQEDKAKRDFEMFKYDGVRAFQTGKTAYAIRCFQEALKIREEVETLELLIRAYTNTEKLEQAIEAAGRLIALKPDEADPFLVRAHLYFLSEDYPPAIADCKGAIEKNGNDAQAYYLLGRVQYAAGDGLATVLSLSQAIALKEDFVAAHLLRAEALLKAKDYKEGMEDVEKVIGWSPDEENAYLLRGQLYEALENSKSAEDDYRYVIELNPFNEQAYLRLGSLFITRKQPDEAIELFDEAIELKPDFARAYSERGRARLMKGDKNGSFEDMKKAIELNPDGEEAQKAEGKYSNFEEMYSNKVL